MPFTQNYARADHDRDIAKHEPRPSDNIPSAHTIAYLARTMEDGDAAALIEKYAETIASIRVERAVSDVYTRVTHIIDGSFKPVSP